MSINDLMRFDVFADRLFLSYLTKHAIWGGPAPIPSSEWRWTPNPTNILITEAACRRFRETAERLAYAVPLEKKLGGVTFAGKVRELYEATLDQAGKASGMDSTVPAERAWDFTVARSKKGVVLDVTELSERARLTNKRHSAEQIDSTQQVSPDRRDFCSLIVALPGALMAKKFLRTAARAPQTDVSNDVFLSPERRILTDRLVENAASTANALTRLLDDPDSGFCWSGRTTQAGDRIFEIDEDAFISPFELATALASTVNPETGRPGDLADCRRYIIRAEEDKHVRYHRSTAKIMLRDIANYFGKGTNWYGPYAMSTSPWSDLVASALFELQNHRAAIRGREDLISAYADPFTLEWEAQLLVGPFLFRREAATKLVGPVICCNSLNETIGPVKKNNSMPTSYLWTLQSILSQ